MFTRRLIEALRSGGEQTSFANAFADLQKKVSDEVMKDRGVKQIPGLKDEKGIADLKLAAPAEIGNPSS